MAKSKKKSQPKVVSGIMYKCIGGHLTKPKGEHKYKTHSASNADEVKALEAKGWFTSYEEASKAVSK